MKRKILFVFAFFAFMVAPISTIHADVQPNLSYVYSGSWRNGFYASYSGYLGSWKNAEGHYNKIDLNSGNISGYYCFTSPQYTGPVDYVMKIKSWTMLHVECDYNVLGTFIGHRSL